MLKLYIPCSISEQMFLRESITPFPLPVVPEVNTVVMEQLGIQAHQVIQVNRDSSMDNRTKLSVC